MKNQVIVINAYTIGGKKFANVPVSEIRVDSTYQRTLRRHVLLMAANWDYDKCDALVVSYRDGVFWVIDGQHRYEAAKRNNVEYLPCQIYEGLTQHQEAVKFVQSNTNIALLSPYDTYRANLLIGDPVDTTVKRICDSFYVKIVEDRGKREASTLGSLDGARRIVKVHGEECLKWVFGILCAAKWNDHPNGLNSLIVSALKNAYVHNMENKNSVFNVCVELLSKIDYRHLVAAAVSDYPKKSCTSAVSTYINDYIQDSKKAA